MVERGGINFGDPHTWGTIGQIGEIVPTGNTARDLVNQVTRGFDVDSVRTVLNKPTRQRGTDVQAARLRIENTLSYPGMVLQDGGNILARGSLYVVGANALGLTHEGIGGVINGAKKLPQFVDGVGKSLQALVTYTKAHGPAALLSAALAKVTTLSAAAILPILAGVSVIDNVVSLVDGAAGRVRAYVNKIAERRAIGGVLNEIRRQRATGYLDTVVKTIEDVDPIRGAAIATVWNTNIVNKLHQAAVHDEVDKVVKRLDKHRLSLRKARRVARLAEAVYTDVIPDPQVAPTDVAEMIRMSNFIQTPGHFGRLLLRRVDVASTYGALVNLTNNAIGVELDKVAQSRQRQISQEWGDLFAVAKDLTKKRGPFFPFKWRKASNWNNIQGSVKDIEAFVMKNADLLKPQQIELLTRLAENLQVPSRLRLLFKRRKRNKLKIAKGRELLARVKAANDKLRITSQTEADKITKARALEDIVLGISQTREVRRGRRKPTENTPYNRIVNVTPATRLSAVANLYDAFQKIAHGQEVTPGKVRPVVRREKILRELGEFAKRGAQETAILTSMFANTNDISPATLRNMMGGYFDGSLWTFTLRHRGGVPALLLRDGAVAVGGKIGNIFTTLKRDGFKSVVNLGFNVLSLLSPTLGAFLQAGFNEFDLGDAIPLP